MARTLMSNKRDFRLNFLVNCLLAYFSRYKITPKSHSDLAQSILWLTVLTVMFI